MVPKNYRVNTFQLFGREITIAGMAGPHNNKKDDGTVDIDAPLDHLRRFGRTVLVGLHEEYNFTDAATRHGLEYHYIPVDDFSNRPISPTVYDSIYAIVKKATEQGKQVAIHCGSGNGRSGTALASIKLRELLEQQARVTPAILGDRPEPTTSIVIFRQACASKYF